MAFCPNNHPIHPNFVNVENQHCCQCYVEGFEHHPLDPMEAHSAQSSNGAPVQPQAYYNNIQTTCSAIYDHETTAVWVDFAIWDCSDEDISLIVYYPYQAVWIDPLVVHDHLQDFILPPLPQDLPPFLEEEQNFGQN